MSMYYLIDSDIEGREVRKLEIMGGGLTGHLRARPEVGGGDLTLVDLG